MRSDNSLHAMSTPWALRDYAINRRSEFRGSAVARPGNATVAVGAPWHLHVMENVKLFAIFFSIFVRSHGALRNFKSPCQRRGIAVECDRGFTKALMAIFLNNWSVYSLNNLEEMRKYVYILPHASTLMWHRGSKSMETEGKDLFAIHSQYRDNWWPS